MSRLRVVTAMTLVALVGASAAGGSVFQQEDPVEQSPTPDPALVAEALRFGGIVLPPDDVTVLGADRSQGVDQMYRLAVQVDAAGLEQLLDESGFTSSLRDGRRVFMPTVAGFDLSESSDVASAQDRLSPRGERTATVIREVLVDRSDPAAPTIHLWLFTT